MIAEALAEFAKATARNFLGRLVAGQGSTFLRHESNSRGGRKSRPRPRRIRDGR